MNSIHRFLARWQLTAFGLLFGFGAVVLYAVVRVVLLAEFDAGLESKAAAIRAFTKQTAEGIEWENFHEVPSEFERITGSDYFQIRLPGGETFRRSVSLATNDLLPNAPAPHRAWFSDLILPNGQPGRALVLRYTPFVDKGERRPAHVRERKPRPDFTPVEAHLVVASTRVHLDRALHNVLLGVVAAGALFLVGTVLIVRLSLRRGLAPLNLLATQTAAIDAASLQVRFPTENLPAELRPIGLRLNELLARLEAAFERERRFSSDVAHELRTPIGELRTLAEVALQWGREAEATSAREALDIALQMEAMVNRLFDLARCEHDQMPVRSESVSLAGLLQELWTPLASCAEQKRLAVRFEVPAAVSLRTDPVLLRAILSNLLANAAEYTPPGGDISVQVYPSGPRFCVRVANTADRSITADLPHLFERFWRKDAARSAPEHCGLGLAVSRAFARQLGCCLDASLDGRSTLVLTLSGLVECTRDQDTGRCNRGYGRPVIDTVRRAAYLLTFALLTCLVNGAGTPAANETDELFGLTNLWTIHLTFARSNWAALEPSGPGDAGPFRPRPGSLQRVFEWSQCDFECAGQTLTNVAIRYKGNSSFSMSRDSLKRPFKVDFDRGFKGRRFLGVEELSLNNNFNDSTQLKEALAYQICREAGLPAPRTAFARVYLTISGRFTNELLGLYTLAETVEGDFLKRHFDTKKGLLLKPERLPSLEYLGEDWKAYTNRYDPKTDAKPVETERFIALIRLIASADDATLRRELPERMDMDSLLRYLAVNALLANYDSFVGNGHNYYLFQAAEGGKAVFIPWDLNEAFGGHPPLGPRLRQAEFSVLRPLAQKNRLIERVLADPTWAAEYRRTLSNLLTNACKPSRLQAATAQIAAVTRQTVFAESPLAKAMFQRTVLGASVDLPARAPEGRPRPVRVDLEEPPLADWITVRMRNAADELAGKRQGLTPRFRPFGGPP